MAKRTTRRVQQSPPDRSTLPSRISPMLAVSGEPFDSDKHLFEVKWDGTRCVAFVLEKSLRLQNRRFIEMRERYPEFACLTKLTAGTVLDGEVVVLADGKPSFNKLQQREHLQDPKRIEMVSQRLPATFMVFDVLFSGGRNLMAQPLAERRDIAQQLVSKIKSPHVIAADFVLTHGKKLFAEIERHGMEGIMAKRLDSPYIVGKRSSHWIKIKVSSVAEYPIIGYTKREGENVISAIIIGMPHGRGWHYKGKVGSGFTEAHRALLFDRFVSAPALDQPPKNGPAEAEWRDTGLVCKVRYFEKTKTGMLRAPVFLGLID